MWLLIGFIIATLINVILSTLKSVITVKGGRVVASLTNAVAYGFNTICIKSISDVELWIAVLVTVLSNLVGVYIALTIMKKFEKERLWKITISVPSESLKDLKQDLHDNHLGFITYETSYEKYKVVDVFSHGKEESRLLRSLLNKYKAKYTINANDGTL
jgi:hypothetical protein